MVLSCMDPRFQSIVYKYVSGARDECFSSTANEKFRQNSILCHQIF